MARKATAKILLLIATSALLITPLAVWTLRAEAPDKPAPLLDREVFFGYPDIGHAELSPSGSHIAFLKPLKDTLNIWVKKTEEPFSAARPVTSSTSRSIRSFSWSKDGAFILFPQDVGGDENFHLFAADPYPTEQPFCRDLTPYDGVRAELLCLPKNSPELAYVGLNDRDNRYHDVYRICLATGERTLIRQNDNKISDWIFDRTGTLRLGVRTTEDGGTELLKVDGIKLPVLWSCSFRESAEPFCFHKDGQHLYMATDKGNEADLSRFVLLDTTTGEEVFLEEDPEHEVDFHGPIFSTLTDELVATSYLGDRQRIYFKDQDWENDYRIIKSSLPDGEIAVVSSTLDESMWIICLRSDIDPATAYLYNRKDHALTFLYKAYPALPTQHLCAMKPMSYLSRDGLLIHAYLTLPKGVDPYNLPLIALPHGGPWVRDTWSYDGEVQLLANRGYAVLQMNYRGSTGYGKKFMNAGNKQWGDAMQNDITDGVSFLIKQGIVDPKRVGIFGGSYGGYATLAGLAFTPDLYAAGISYVGPSNLITLLKSFPPYWVTDKGRMNEMVGDPDNPEDLSRLKRQSPLFSARNITAPLLVVQGANDPRVKKAESDQIVIALRTLGRDVEYIVAPDEGHGFLNGENRIAFAVAMEKFLSKHLGGRCQEEVPDTIKNRLEEITVDIKTVALETSS